MKVQLVFRPDDDEDVDYDDHMMMIFINGDDDEG